MLAVVVPSTTLIAPEAWTLPGVIGDRPVERCRRVSRRCLNLTVNFDPHVNVWVGSLPANAMPIDVPEGAPACSALVAAPQLKFSAGIFVVDADTPVSAHPKMIIAADRAAVKVLRIV